MRPSETRKRSEFHPGGWGGGGGWHSIERLLVSQHGGGAVPTGIQTRFICEEQPPKMRSPGVSSFRPQSWQNTNGLL